MAPVTNRLRIAFAAIILLVMAAIGARILPIYLDNLELQRYVEDLARSADSRTRPDDVLRVAVMEKAASLGLPVKAPQVHVHRSEGAVRIDVRYVVTVDMPLYTVDLHFYPGAGSR
jgi:hypothetical protein